MAGYSYSIQGGPASTFPPREFIEQQQQQQQEQLQYQQYQQFQQDYLQQQQQYVQHRDAPSQRSSQLPPPARNPKRGSTRPASSIYSQPSPINTNFQIHQQQQPPQLQQQQQYQHYGHSQSAGGHQAYQQMQQPPQQQQQQQHYQYQDPRTQYQYYSQPRDLRNADGVSPESSPELSAVEPVYNNSTGRQAIPSISPVDREPNPFDMSATQAVPQANMASDGRPPSASRTNIPMMRRERRQNAEATAKTLREAKSRERLEKLHQAQERTNSMASSKRGYKGGEVRWDPQTGELTSSQKGRPSQVKPAEYARGLADTGGDATSPTEATAKEGKAASAASGIASFASRLRKTVQGVNTGAANSSPAPAQQPPAQPPKQVVTPRSPAAPRTSLPVASPPAQAPVAVVPAPAAALPRDLSTSTDPAAGAFTSNRPAWNGASGRTTLVAPVRDTTEVAPLNIPRKSSKRVGSLPKLADDTTTTANSNNIPSSPPQQAVSSIQTPQQTQTQTPSRKPLQSPASPGTQSYPSPPQSADPTYKASLSSQQQQTPVQQVQQQQQPQDQRPPSSKIRRKPTPSHQTLASYDESDPFNYNNRSHPNFVPSPVSPRPPPQGSEWTQPPSRFSVTTYNSTLQESPAEFDASDAPEMPSIPNPLRSSPPYQTQRRPVIQVESSPVQQQPSPPRQKPTPIITKPLPGIAAEGNVMDRRRPPRMGHTSPNSIRNGNEPIVISLKTPWMTGNYSPLRDTADGNSDCVSSGGEDEGAAGDSAYNQLRNKHLMGTSGDASDRASMAGSIHKNLPLAPPEMTAKDRVAMFNAQLSNLAQRRINIGRGIKQMTELMPTDNLLAAPDVLYKREMEKRKVEGLRTELAEIQREEYEIGLKLHRAYKRLDKNAEYEPTTLWVRRVTG
ncbi:hypothetical protein SBRCBS47491_009508 [Sporothrix bragantina]|uniref:Uncharacterized protein n=1 Tax=Sporothrix bragantina TaxID=671064 RepID=A0ABP0CVI9_9PEZI